MPVSGEIAAAIVVVGAVLMALLLVRILPGWLRGVRRPESRKVRVVAVGGGGNNAVDHMVGAGFDDVTFVRVNTDAQALRRSIGGQKIRIGVETTGGLGSGGDPDVGRRAAEEDRKYIESGVGGADLVFVAAGLGGGTGSGAAPIVAASAREKGALTIGVVTKPFAFEGSERMRIADAAAAELAATVDALIVVPNERVGDLLPANATMVEAFGAVDDVLLHAVQAILDLIIAPGLINLDFADIRSIMDGAGLALIGIGRGSGEDRAVDAARQAIASPLLEANIEGARRILFNVSGPPDLRLAEVRVAANEIAKHAHADANVIFGANFNDAPDADVVVTLIATGLAPVGGAPAPAVDADPAAVAVARAAADEPPPIRAPRRKTPAPARSAPPAPVEASGNGAPLPPDAAAEPSDHPLDEEELEVPSFMRRR